MSTAQAYFEIFKALPKKTRKEVQKLINNDEETVSISVKHFVTKIQIIQRFAFDWLSTPMHLSISKSPELLFCRELFIL